MTCAHHLRTQLRSLRCSFTLRTCRLHHPPFPPIPVPQAAVRRCLAPAGLPLAAGAGANCGGRVLPRAGLPAGRHSTPLLPPSCNGHAGQLPAPPAAAGSDLLCSAAGGRVAAVLNCCWSAELQKLLLPLPLCPDPACQLILLVKLPPLPIPGRQLFGVRAGGQRVWLRAAAHLHRHGVHSVCCD